MQEKTKQTKTCKHCNSNFEITDKDLEFYDKISPIFEDKKYSIPTPTLCPNCRQQRRLSFRNERNLYKRDCDASGKSIISIYSPDKDLKVYNQEEWWSDSWNSLNYWMNFDYSKTFFSQYKELLERIPKVSIINKNSINSPYTNLCANNNNCYLLIESSDNENCSYSYWLQESRDCIDCSFSSKCELCYNIDNCFSCYKLFNSRNCINCDSSEYLENCTNCSYCYNSKNLNWKKYFIENKRYSKEDYFSKLEKKLLIKRIILPNKNLNIKASENCTWDYILNSRNCFECYHAQDTEDSKYSVHILRNAKNIYDSDTIWLNTELIYESINTAIYSFNALFCNRCWTVNNCIYCDNCDNSSNLFWCVWLKNKQYCILNQQYTKEEYNKLVPQIIEYMKKTWEWWEFFPSSISSFWYNETVAQEYFSINKEEAKNKWFKWSDYESPKPNVEKIIPAEKLPDNIEDIPDDILNWAIKCEVTQKPFRIIKQELEFYRKHNLPIPKKHPDQRHLERIQLRNPRKLFNRKCDKCWIEMKTTYASDRKEIVYCEKCYEKEVY